MKSLLGVALAVVIAGSAGLAINSESNPLSAAPEVLIVPGSTDGRVECELQCNNGCFTGQHDAIDVGESGRNAMRNGGAHPEPPDNCFSGSCDTKHGPVWPECDVPVSPETLTQPELIESVRLAVLAKDAARLGTLTAKYPSWIKLNQERAAIQVANCKGRVVAHLPLMELRPVH